MSRSERSIALGWWAAAALAAGAWLLGTGPIEAVAEFAVALAVPIAVGRTTEVLRSRSRTAPALAAAVAATTFFLLDLFLLRGAAPLPGMLGAAIGYRSIRRRLEGRSDAEPELLHARTIRRLVVGLMSGSFAVACVWRAGLLEAADLRAEWQIRALLSGIVGVWALVSEAVARFDLWIDER